jgi:hypothetical protein
MAMVYVRRRRRERRGVVLAESFEEIPLESREG